MVISTPSFVCPNDNNGGKLSKFTVDDTKYGNGALKGYAKISTRQPNQDGYKELLQKLDAIEQAISKVKIPSK